MATIGIIATASRPLGKYFRDGIEKLTGLGFTIIDFTESKRNKITDKSRVNSLMQAAADPRVDLILAVRGGYGTLRILHKIDYAQIAKSKKIIVGFSDLTALSLALYHKRKMVTFCGPMLSTSFFKGMPALTLKSFLDHVTGVLHEGSTINLSELGAKCYRAGKISGRLMGGNMAVMSRLIGTEYLPDLKDCILYLEDVDENRGRLENIFMHYRLAGVFDKIGGLMLGQFSNCFRGSKKVQLAKLVEFVDDMLGDYKFPIIYNLPFGHEDKNMTLPVGISADLNTKTGKLKYLESPVR